MPSNLEDLDDPITWSVELKNGNLMWDQDPSRALVHYRTAVAIGAAALPPGYTGLLPWGWIDNRPFLRGLHSMGLALWRLGREAEAAKVLETMLWLNPSDQQGVRFNVAAVKNGVPWKDWED